MANTLVLLEAAFLAGFSTFFVFKSKKKLEKAVTEIAGVVILVTAIWMIQADVHIAPIVVKTAISILLIPIAIHAFKQVRPRPVRQKRT
jgi:hypothetical protein